MAISMSFQVGAKTTYNSTQCVCKMESDQEVAGSGDLLSTSAPTPDQQQGSVGGAKAVQPVRKVKKVVKRVSFASALFVAPNPIDFDKAFAGFSNLSENPVAFSTVLSIFGVYLIMLFWARREDRKDLLKVIKFWRFCIFTLIIYLSSIVFYDESCLSQFCIYKLCPSVVLYFYLQCLKKSLD